jgi:WLM domain
MANHDAADMVKSDEDGATIDVTVHYHGNPIEGQFFADATIKDLVEGITENLHIPESNIKFMIQKLGVLKPPFENHASTLLATLNGKKITLLASSPAQINALNSVQTRYTRTRRPGAVRAVAPVSNRNSQQAKEEALYTFQTLRPLAHLPNPSKSLSFLAKLRDDPGIKSVMRAHKWSVPLLTEMDPSQYTASNHEGTTRILGLNRNKGEVIELRLRTDAFDGYRDYKTIRKTLCHELTHNVWGDHDRNFWDLCKQVEKEVDKADWSHGGHSVGNGDVYMGPSDNGDVYDEDDHIDGGGWEGGEFVLGGSGGNRSAGWRADVVDGAMSRREILAKAAEEREKKRRQQTSSGNGEGSASGAPTPGADPQ